MVDSKGYMYMIDMGTAKILKQSKHPGKLSLNLINKLKSYFFFEKLIINESNFI